jgi:hypothetical protein
MFGRFLRVAVYIRMSEIPDPANHDATPEAANVRAQPQYETHAESHSAADSTQVFTIPSTKGGGPNGTNTLLARLRWGSPILGFLTALLVLGALYAIATGVRDTRTQTRSLAGRQPPSTMPTSMPKPALRRDRGPTKHRHTATLSCRALSRTSRSRRGGEAEASSSLAPPSSWLRTPEAGAGLARAIPRTNTEQASEGLFSP